jgi:hypothetical protein
MCVSIHLYVFYAMRRAEFGAWFESVFHPLTDREARGESARSSLVDTPTEICAAELSAHSKCYSRCYSGCYNEPNRFSGKPQKC